MSINKYIWVIAGVSRSGKTTLINKVAKITQLIPVDMDDLINTKNVIDRSSFRLAELDAYQNFQPTAGMIIALGGGALLNPKIFQLTKSWGIRGRLLIAKKDIYCRWSQSAPFNFAKSSWDREYNIRYKASIAWSSRIWCAQSQQMLQQMYKIIEDKHGK